ncbi:hypothetical protein D3C75_800460 [compost metagenome]
MAIELVKHPQLLLMRKPGAILIHPRHAGFGVDMLRIVGNIRVRKESPDRESKTTIVHRRIFGIGLQPLTRIAKMLAQNIRFWLGFFCRFGDTADMQQIILRATRFAEHVHHIKPPTVDAPWFPQPVAHDTVFALVNLVNQRS